MSLNKYFINHNSRYEQNLIEDLVVETIKIHGFDMYYIPRELMTQPNIFGDDPMSSFKQHFIIEMYLQSVDGFEGDGDFIGKFGLEIRDSATFVVSKKRFQNITEKFRPFEGDILYFPHTKKFFEIKFVEHENPFYQLGKNYVYSLQVELFQFSEETVNTQIDEIDDAVEKKEYDITLTLGVTAGTGTFSVGEKVFSFNDGSTSGSITGSDSSGTVISYSSNKLKLRNIIGPWRKSTSTKNRYAISSGSVFHAKITDSLDKVEENDEFNDNKVISDKINDFLDFSEDNPFGEII